MIAFTRAVSPLITECELTFRERTPIDYKRAVEQLEGYRQALGELGVVVRQLPNAADQPDSVFVEDTAVVVDEVAVVTYPGAESRRDEVATVRSALSRHRSLREIEPPGTLEGGDVFRVNGTLYVGRSTRTNRAGIEQLREHLAPYGYEILTVPVTGCLHLGTGCSYMGDGRALCNRAWIDADALKGLEVIEVAEAEPWAANTVYIGETVLMAAGFPETARRLRDAGCEVRDVEISEFLKAEGGVSCMSLRIEE